MFSTEKYMQIKYLVIFNIFRQKPRANVINCGIFRDRVENLRGVKSASVQIHPVDHCKSSRL